MKRKRHSTDQIIRKLREAEQFLAGGMSVEEVCRRIEVSVPTLHRWKAKYRGMDKAEIKRLSALEDENRRLRKLVSDQALDILILKEVNQGKW